MQTSAIPTGTTPDKLVLDPHWTATATKSIYNASLTDARLHAARGEHDSFSAGSIATLHLLNAVDEIQYQTFHNEIRFLESRHSQRIAEALAASSQGEQKDDLWPDLIEYATSGQKIPTLNPGERYAGIALDDTGKATHHLILLPQITDIRLNWDDAMAWAEAVRGTLPTRQEQALLFANCKDAFEPTWYWSCEQYAGDASFAWIQNFGDGYQYNFVKSYKGRVRAVRRFLID